MKQVIVFLAVKEVKNLNFRWVFYRELETWFSESLGAQRLISKNERLFYSYNRKQAERRFPVWKAADTQNFGHFLLVF